MCLRTDYPKSVGKNDPHLGAAMSLVCSKLSKNSTAIQVGREREERVVGEGI